MYDSLWFDSLNKPFLNPPSWIFAPVWTILYLLIFASLVIYILKFTKQNKVRGYIYLVLQMCLNLAWSPVFFYFKNIGLALIIIILLDIFVVLMIREFYKVSKISGLLNIPYLLWILFATYLNISYFILN